MSENKPSQTSRKGQGQYGLYKSLGRYEANKKRRAKRHSQRMIDQVLRVNKRYDAGKKLPSKTWRKIAFSRGLGA